MSKEDETLTLAALVERAREHTRFLYDGVETPHRSCGISLAETFGRATPPYQSLRKGGITGCGECGAIKAGELILGEVLGDPDPTGAVTPELRHAALRYRELWQQNIERGDAPATSIVCNDLTGQFDDFRSHARHTFCTNLAAMASESLAQTLAEVAPERRDAWAAVFQPRDE